MRNKIKFRTIATIVACCSISTFVDAQMWNAYSSGLASNYDQCDENNNIESVGIGDFNGNGVAPLSALHINTNFLGYLPNNASYNLGEVFRTDAPNIATHWRMFRGGTQYGRLYSQPFAGFLIPDFDFHIEATQRDLMIHALGVSNNATITQRVRVTSGSGLGYGIGGTVINLDNVTETVIERGGGLPNLQWPRAMLNIGTDVNIAAQAQGGWRDWMDVGTFSIFYTDNMYVGLKIEPNNRDDRHDAVISWGDNDALQGGGLFGPDNLRFIYTTSVGIDGSPEAQPDGSEIARMTPDGLMGIGNFTLPANGGGSGIQPLRRLEIYDQHFNNNTPNPAPQFRLTFDPNPDVDAGINTDFQCTGRGNLIVNTRSDGRVRYTGIGNFNVLGVEPVRRLEILDMNEEAPQLRLTFTPDPQVNIGIWTDFQTTSRGDLFIHPSAAAQDRYVGINELSPGNTLVSDTRQVIEDSCWV